MAKQPNGMFRKSRLVFNVQEAQQHDFVFFNNPVFVQGFALAAAAGGASTLQSAVILAAAGSFLILPVRILGDWTVGIVRARLRILVYALLSALLCIPVLLLSYRWFGADAILLGLYLPLLFLDSVVTWRAADARREGKTLVVRGAVLTAAGFSLALVLCGALRELLGAGTLWERQILPVSLWPGAQTLPGGLLVVGLLAALWQFLAGLAKRLIFIGGRESDD